jgi:Domain of unknown function (DUF4159)/Aerotolerance regulator N-terminal
MSGLLGALAILQPWWLAALAALPILYWLLRVTPPAPRHARFPAIRLLLALQPKEETPAQTPLWLLLLRLFIAALIIFALAHPLANPGAKLAGAGPLLLVVDDGWAAGRNWPAHQSAMADILDRAEREERPVMILATAPTVTGESPRPSRLMRATEAKTIVGAIMPKSWPVDRAAALAALEGVSFPQQAAIVYLSDGVEDGQSFALLERLQRLGGVELFTDPPSSMPRLVLPPANEAGSLAATATRLTTADADSAVLRASGEDGRLIAREELRWAPGERSATARISVPTELRNRIARLDIENENSAGAVVLLDERWRRRPVGLVSGASVEKLQPLLADTYYLERALTPFSEVRTGDLQDILKREIAVVILADVGHLPEGDRNALEQWVKRGGVVVRFAGARMAEGSDDFVPVPLRGGGRAFGGAMTWAQPVALAAFDPNSPFAGLPIPDDVRVTRQVLAEPSLDLASHTWARLSDGTPLVTADKRDDGWLVLVHTTANPEWSSLPLSGLFVEMLQRLVGLSQGVAGAGADIALPPVSSLDGFGRLQSPPPAAVAIPPGGFNGAIASPKNPPGYYGTETSRRALNLSAAMPAPRLIQDMPSGVARAVYTGAREIDFRPWLLSMALALALLDLFVSLALRGVWAGRARRTAAVLLAASTLIAAPAIAQTSQPNANAPATDDNTAILATLTTRFAFVTTGIAEIDDTSRAGMAGLGAVLTRRTAVDPGPPVEVDPEHDELSFYPLIYWPISPQGPRLSSNAVQRVNAYLKNGGTIVFDTREGEAASGPAALRLREILRQLNLAPLAPIPEGHVLTKAFYLLSDFPGRWTGGPVWVELGDDRVNDGVSSVIIGGHDWAAAWAVDQNGRPMYAAVPGGEAQRETAIRFGVNLVMYALTGNYKADQVHVEAILDRLRR